MALVRTSTTSQRDTTSLAVVLQYYPRQGSDVESIHLHQVPRLHHRVASGLTDGVWASPKALTSGDTIAGCLLEYATGLQVAQDSPHLRGGDLPSSLP